MVPLLVSKNRLEEEPLDFDRSITVSAFIKHLQFKKVKTMKIERNNEQKKLKKGKQKNMRSGKTNLTLQAQSVTVYDVVKLRIKTEQMTARKCDRLRIITTRDTRICNDYLRIIKHNEEKILQKNGQIDKSLLDKLTLTTYRNTEHKLRTTVPHDLKKRYPRCSQNELQECRDKAIWTYEGWITQQRLAKKELNRPSFKKKSPRTQLIHNKRFRVISKPENTVAKLWLDLRDSLDTKRSSRTKHKRLILPLAFSPYHKQKLKLEKIKTVELVYDPKKQQWWAHFTLQYTVPLYQSTQSPAVLGVDIGIKKTAVAVLLTQTGKVIMDDIRFIVDKERQQRISKLIYRIKSIQRLLDTRINNAQPTKQLNTKLRQLRRRLRSIREQELGYAVNQLVDFILQLKKRYNLFISIGYPKDIRKGHPRGSGNKSLRDSVHKWRFRLFVTKLKHKLAFYGFESYRVVAIGESGTSQQCSGCNSFNTTRTGQGQFNCHDCGYDLNADLNAAKNIGKRLIQYAIKPKYGFTRIGDKLLGEYHPIPLYRCLTPLSQWLEDSFKSASTS